MEQNCCDSSTEWIFNALHLHLISLRITSFLQHRESEERLRKRWGTRQISSQVTNTLNINKGNTSYKGKQSDLSMQRLTHTYSHTHTYTGQQTLLTDEDINSHVKANTILSI